MFWSFSLFHQPSGSPTVLYTFSLPPYLDIYSSLSFYCPSKIRARHFSHNFSFCILNALIALTPSQGYTEASTKSINNTCRSISGKKNAFRIKLSSDRMEMKLFGCIAVIFHQCINCMRKNLIYSKAFFERGMV